MQITYNPIYHKYQVIGTKQISLAEKSVVSKVKLDIVPKRESIFSKNQKIRFNREVLTIKDNESTLFRFNREAANRLFFDFELEFNNYGIPIFISNYKEIWKNWLYQVDTLHSKYEGSVVDRLINRMTITLGDEKLFTERLLKDFSLNEMYQREIHKIVFDEQTYSASREWTEIVFTTPLIFNQNYKLSLKNDGDKLTIRGIADIEKNKQNLLKLCKNESFNIEDIVSIEQETTYFSKNISYSPDRIISHFFINGRDSFLKKVEIELNIEKLDRI